MKRDRLKLVRQPLSYFWKILFITGGAVIAAMMHPVQSAIKSSQSPERPMSINCWMISIIPPNMHPDNVNIANFFFVSLRYGVLAR